jgi:ABC-type transport system substrate-binding protein
MDQPESMQDGIASRPVASVSVGRPEEQAAVLSRRMFLRRTAMLSSAAALAACGGPAATPPAQTAADPTPEPAEPQSAEEPATDAPAPDASSGGPRVGGTYRILGQGNMRSLDPPAAEGSEDWWSAGMLLYNQLYFFDHEGSFYADLAAADPEISEDGLVYTIPLRQGVKFHNGREMVADDVKFSLERQLWPEVYSWGKTYMDNVVGYQAVIDGTSKELEGIVVVDPYTVRITLEQAQAVFPALLSMSMNAIVPRQEVLDAGEAWGVTTVIGTGPFRFVEWRAGERAVYERNPEYFKAGLPYLERIELDLQVDAAVQMLRWESGEAESIHNIPAAELPRVLNDPQLKELMRTAPATGVLRFGIQHTVEPFDDLRVRQAIAHAIDKQALVQKLSGTITALEGYYALPMLQFDSEFRSNYQYDPDRARALLTEAGHGDGIRGLKMFGSGEIAELIQADLQAIGVEVELVSTTLGESRDPIRAGEIALFIYGWSASFPDAFDYVSAWTSCAARETGYNDGMYCNERIDELLKTAEGLPLQASERLAAYREIEDIVINQDVGFIGLYNEQRLGLGVAKVHDDFMHGIYGWPSLETAWMDA